jgi:membrane-associated phospholipid phosphatase
MGLIKLVVIINKTSYILGVKSPMIEPGNTGSITVAGARKRRLYWLAWVFRFRIEEFLALLFIAPIIFYTSKAYLIYRAQGRIPAVFIADIQRVLVISVLIVVALIIVKIKPRLEFLRSFLPFAYCTVIYTNFHDTIQFMNPHDVHFTIIRFEHWLFGVQPSVWAQQFIHPWLTEMFSYCYWAYFILIPLVPLILFFQRRYPQFREALISTLLCFYAGYVLYVIFPAVSPSVILKDAYSVQLGGGPFTDATMRFANTLPLDVRDAFPSLHSAIALLSLLFAWKYLRRLFWILLPICIGLVLSTIYLRHHYFVDLPAGFLLGYLGFKYGGQIDRWWRSKQTAFKTAR